MPVRSATWVSRLCTGMLVLGLFFQAKSAVWADDHRISQNLWSHPPAGTPVAGLNAEGVEGAQGVPGLRARLSLPAGDPTAGRAFSYRTGRFVLPPAQMGRPVASRASGAQVGAVMALLAAWSETSVLPPESTPEANRIIKALIQVQGLMMKSDHAAVRRFFEEAVDQKFGTEGVRYLQQARRTGWSADMLEALSEYVSAPGFAPSQSLQDGFHEFNITVQDVRLLADLHEAAKRQLQSEGRDLHALYEEKRRLMPGAASAGGSP